MQYPKPPEGILRFRPFRSRHLRDWRTVDIWLPPEYHENPWAKYPVIYVLDGQNVFDPRTSFIPGKTWRADKTAREAMLKRRMRPCILVAVWNGGSKRLDEYTGSRDPKYDGGKSEEHDHFLMDELMPWVVKSFRVDKTPEKTALVGASLGGLYSLEFAVRHPHRVGAIGVLSPSLWWDNRRLMETLRHSPLRNRCRVWLDIGSLEGKSAVENVRELSAILAAKGLREGHELRTVIEAGAGHDEDAWAGRIGPCLEHLLPRNTAVN